jgi:hypothetical protein
MSWRMKLESVRADLLAASRSYESCKKKDLALRFYLATRSLLREYELLNANLRRAERRAALPEPANQEVPPALPNGRSGPQKSEPAS